MLHRMTTGLAVSPAATTEIEGGLTGLAADIMERLGYIGIAALIALESAIPPIPSEAVLPLGGALAAQGRFSLVGVIVAATVGSVLGALLLYAAGAWLGRRRIHELVDRFGRRVGVSSADIHKAEAWFARYGTIAVLLGRMVPIVRSLVSVPAGFAQMSLPAFIVYTTIGSLCWNTALVGVGWLLGDNWGRVEGYVAILEYVVIAVVAVLVLRFAWRRFRPTA